MYAIIEDSGTQIKVSTGDVLEVDLRQGDQPESITFDRVLMVAADKDKPSIGTPYLDGATVTAEVVEAVKGEKIDVIKYKKRKGYRRKQGHRQRTLMVRIGEISTAAAKPKPTKKKTTKKKTAKKADA